MRHKKLLASVIAGVSLSLLAVALLPKTSNVIKANAAEETATLQPSNVTAAGDLTDDKSNTWSFSYVAESINKQASYIHVGSNSKNATSLTLSTTAFNTITVKSISVWAAAKNSTNATSHILIGGNEVATSDVLTNNAASGGTELAYDNSTAKKTGAITIEVSRPTQAQAALYLNKIEVVYEGGTPTDPITKIEVTTPPTKTSYHVGESFDPTGMYVEGTHEGGTKEEITDYIYAPEGPLDVGTEEITINYGQLSCTTPISVIEPTITSIVVTNMPTKVDYYVGDDLETDGLVVMGTCSHCSEQIDVTASCSFSPTTFVATDIGSKEITVTYAPSVATSFNVNVSAAPAKAKYSIVKTNNLAVGDEIVIATAGSVAYVMTGTINNDRYVGASVTKSSGLDSFTDDSGSAMVLTLEQGYTDTSFAFKNENGKYIAGKNDTKLAVETTITASSSWTIAIDGDGVATFTNVGFTTRMIKLNPQNNVFGEYTASSSGMVDVSVFKYSGGNENITLNETEASGPTGDSISLTATPTTGYEPTSYHWEVSDTAVLSLDSDSDQTVIVTYEGEGVATATCTASDGTIIRQASCTITVHNYVYDVLTSNEYIITDYTFKVGMSTTNPRNNVTDINYSDGSSVFLFERANKADNSYYIRQGDSYVEKGASTAYLAFVSEPTTYWVVSRPTSGVEIFNLIDTEGRYLQHISGGFISGSDVQQENNNKIGLLVTQEFNSLSYSGTLTKDTYNEGEEFDASGLTITATFETFSLDVTGSVTWDALIAGNTSVTGRIQLSGAERTVTVSGITVTGYYCSEIAVDATNAQKDYFVGETTNKTGLVVTATYKDSAGIGPDRVEEVASDKYTLDPEVITSDTEDIRVVYNNCVDTYPVNVTQAKFELSPSITAGDHVVFAAGSDNLEMYNENFEVKEFTYRPHGEKVFEVEKVTNGGWAFRDLDSGEYLSANGKALEYNTSVVPAAVWEVSITRTDTYDTVYIESKSQTDYLYMSYNSDAGKIKMANTSDIEIYEDVTLKKPESIEVDTSSTHDTEFDVGETFSYSGLKIKVNWGGGAFDVISTGFQVETPDMLTAGQKSVTVTYMGVETSYTINVKPSSQHVMVGIEVSGMKNVFIVGEYFSFGGQVKAVFSDNTREPLDASDYVITGQPDEGVPFTEAQVGIKQITVTYKLNTEFKCVYDIEIVSNDHNDLESISVTNPVTTYNVGDEFVKPTVMAQFEFGDPVDVTNEATFSGYNMNQAGTYTVDVSYTAGEITKHTSFTITVSNGGGTSEDPTSGGSSSGSTSEGGDSKKSINVLAWAIPVIIGSVIVLGGVGVGIYFLIKNKKNK